MKILFIKGTKNDITRKFSFPPRQNTDLDTQMSYSPPLGLLYMGSVLEENGHSVEVIDCFYEKKPEEMIQQSLTSADAVGLCIFSDYAPYSTQIAQMIRERDSLIPIIIGGPHSTFFPTSALSDVPAADISIEGEAEHTILDLMKVFQGNKNISELSGIRYREHGEIKAGKPPKVIENLDTLPFPARHLVDKYEYGKIQNVYFRKPKFTSIATNRGCPFQCKFCNHMILPYQRYRERSVDNVLREFQEINEKYKSVYIIDDCFFSNEKRVLKIFEGLIELKTDLEIYIYGGRVDLGDRKLYEKMKRAGVKSIFFGIESGNQDVLEYYNKRITLDQISNTVHLAHEMDFYITGSFIFGAPFETKEHFERTIKFACSLPLDITYWRHLIYEPGTRIWNEAVEKGLIDTNENARYILADSKKGLSQVAAEDIQSVYKKAFFRFYYRPRYVIKEFLKIVRKKDLSLLKAGLGLV
jgi:anaerobic magnesium-protoporphyrin IX monomethyl ester cyclase